MGETIEQLRKILERERTAKLICAELNNFIDTIKKHYNKEPILYTTKDFYSDYLHPEFMNYKIWIRSIFSEPHIIGFDNWVFWQYNARGHMEGIEGFVDLNVFNGSINEFNDLLYSVSK